MKIICAWCHSTIAYQCPVCWCALEEPRREKERGLFMVCRSNVPFTSTDPRKVHTEIHFSIANMTTRLGICPTCYEKFEQESRALAANIHTEETANDAARQRAARAAGLPSTDQVAVVPLCPKCHRLHKKEQPCPPTQQLAQEKPTPQTDDQIAAQTPSEPDPLETALLDAAADRFLQELEKGGEG